MKFTTVIYWVILYPFFQRFKRNIKCWISHNWVKTNRPNVKKCTKCGISQLNIYATFDEDEKR